MSMLGHQFFLDRFEESHACRLCSWVEIFLSEDNAYIGLESVRTIEPTGNGRNGIPHVTYKVRVANKEAETFFRLKYG